MLYHPGGAEQPYGTVVFVTDGDLGEVETQGRTAPVRLIGVDTPKTVAPDQPVGLWPGGRRLRPGGPLQEPRRQAGDPAPRRLGGRLRPHPRLPPHRPQRRRRVRPPLQRGPAELWPRSHNHLRPHLLAALQHPLRAGPGCPGRAMGRLSLPLPDAKISTAKEGSRKLFQESLEIVTSFAVEGLNKNIASALCAH